MGRLDGKTAIITGAAGGIGAATARRFVKEGAQVVLVDRDDDVLARLSAELGPAAIYEKADVTSAADTVRFVQAATKRFGGIDVLFANAGVEGQVCPLTDLSAETFQRVWTVNVLGAFLGIKQVAAEMITRGAGGSIIITSSVAGMIGSRGLGAYVSSKHAVVGLARTAALELASHNIRVNTIHPGPINNRMMRSIEDQALPGQGDEIKRGFEAQIAMGRYGENEEIASVALFLASADSTYCTGSQFVADGGFTAQ